MATNYQLLNEQIRRGYSRGVDREDISPRLDAREVKLYIVQAINSLIKAETASMMESPDTVLASYSVETQGSGCDFHLTLPAIPINLPKNMGIHRIYPIGCPWKPYVPIKNGDFDIAQGTPTEFLEGQIGYYQDGIKIRFTSTPAGTVEIRLIVNDPNTISDTDILPISPEMETMVIDMVIQRLATGTASQYEAGNKNEQITPKQSDS